MFAKADDWCMPKRRVHGVERDKSDGKDHQQLPPGCAVACERSPSDERQNREPSSELRGTRQAQQNADTERRSQSTSWRCVSCPEQQPPCRELGILCGEMC